MRYPSDNPIHLQKDFDETSKREHVRRRLQNISLKDVPLEVRRREAKEPLFLTRYE
jgi:hypothetical protein